MSSLQAKNFEKSTFWTIDQAKGKYLVLSKNISLSCLIFREVVFCRGEHFLTRRWTKISQNSTKSTQLRRLICNNYWLSPNALFVWYSPVFNGLLKRNDTNKTKNKIWSKIFSIFISLDRSISISVLLNSEFKFPPRNANYLSSSVRLFYWANIKRERYASHLLANDLRVQL